jgi:hypothetical protein
LQKKIVYKRQFCQSCALEVIVGPINYLDDELFYNCANDTDQFDTFLFMDVFDQISILVKKHFDTIDTYLNKEKDFIKKYYDLVEPYMTKEGIKEVKQVGQFLYDREFGWVTPTLNGQICAYGYKENGIIKCAFEQAYNDGKIPWKKPISCHLFPIKVQKSKQDPDIEYMNYEPREDLCKAACSLGVKLKVPAYVFLKESIIRKYGEKFYEALDASAQHLKDK